MGLFDKLKQLGPGLVTGAADDDPSGIATYSQAGSQFGPALLWTMLFTYPLMVAVQLASARLGRVTGHGLGHSLGKILPRWAMILLVALLFGANTINIGADLAAMGEASALVAGWGKHGFTIFFAITSLPLQFYVPYHRYASFLKWLTLVLLAYVALLFMVKIDWLAVAKGIVIPTIAGAWAVTVIVAIFGTTISPYLFFWQASQEVEELKQDGDDGRSRTRTIGQNTRSTGSGGIRSAAWPSPISSRWRSCWVPRPRCMLPASRTFRARRMQPARSSRSQAILRRSCSAWESSAPECSRFRFSPVHRPMPSPAYLDGTQASNTSRAGPRLSTR